VLAEEEPFDGQWEWAFKQYRYIDLQAKINQSKKEISLDLSKTNYVYNQSNGDKYKKKWWQILLDS